MKPFSSVIIIGLSTVITGAINYVYHPVMLRALPIATFAEFESLIGIFNVLGVITASLSLFLIKEIVRHKEHESIAKFIFLEWGKWFLGLGLVAYVGYLLFMPITMSILRMHEWIPVAMVGSMLIVSFAGTPASVIVQALGKFKFLAISNIVTSLLKLWLGWTFVLFSASLLFATLWFLGAAFISTLMTVGFSWYILKDAPETDAEPEIKRDLKKSLPNLVQFFILSVLLAIMMNMDVILAPSFFDKETAGAYSAVSVLAKFIMFLIGAIETVYYPRVTGKKDQDDFKKNIFHVGLLIGLSIATGLIWAWMLGPVFLSILKPGFEVYINLFLILIFTFGIYAAISFYTKVMIAKRDYRSNIVLFASSSLFVVPVMLRLWAGLFFYVGLLMGSMIFAIVWVTALALFRKNRL